MSSVIVAVTPITGHMVPLLRVAEILTGAGHDVEFVGGSRFTGRVAAAGARMHPLTGVADYDDRDMTGAFPDRPDAADDPQARVVWDSQHVFGDAIRDQHALLQQLIEEDPERVLVTDNLFLGAWPSVTGAGRRPRRWIAVGISPLYLPSRDTTPFGPVPVPPGADPVAANEAANVVGEAGFAPVRDYVQKIVASLGGQLPDSGYTSLAYLLPDVFAQLTVPQFEFPRSDLPDSIRYAGILPPPAPAEWTPPAWWPHLGAARSVVVVTQGTLANTDFAQLVEPTLTALAGQDLTVVAALGRQTGALSIDVPSNARVADWLPFDQLLPLADVLVTNGGYGGTQQALASGTPVIVCGVSEDKPAVAARVAALGYGLSLATDHPLPTQIAEAVQTVLGDSGYRDRARDLARRYAEIDAASTLVQLVEQVPASQPGR